MAASNANPFEKQTPPGRQNCENCSGALSAHEGVFWLLLGDLRILELEPSEKRAAETIAT